MSITISLCMIVKNEEENLPRCLDSVHGLMDEINIVDTGSTDKTVEIAKKYTDRIFYFDWIDDFSAARNFSFSKATKEYIMWLDADDVIYKEDLEKFVLLKNTLNTEADIVYMDYIYSKDKYGNPMVTLSKERLVKRSCNFKWENKIHEALKVKGKYTTSDINIYHEHADNKKSIARNSKLITDAIYNNEAAPYQIGYHIMHLFLSEDYSEAISLFENFTNTGLGSENFAFYVYLYIHQAYIKQKDYEKAYLVLAQNDNVLNQRSEYHCMLGDFSINVLNDTNIAIKYYERALKCPKGNTYGLKDMSLDDCYYFYPYRALGRCYLLLSRYDDAKQMMEKAYSYKKDESLKTELENLKRLI